MAKGGKVPKGGARSGLQELKEYAESLAPQKGFFSTLDQLVQQAPFETGSQEQWRGYLKPGRMLKRNGMEFPLKKEELDYSLEPALKPPLPHTGLAAFYDVAQPLTKEELLKSIRARRPIFELTDQSYPFRMSSKELEKLVGPGTGEAVGSFVMSGGSGQVTTPPGTRLEVKGAQYGPDHDYGVRLSHQTPGSTYNESITRMKGYNYSQHFDPSGISWSRSSSHKLPEGAGVRLIEEIQSDPHQDAATPREWQDGLTYARRVEHNQLEAELTQLAGTGYSPQAEQVGYTTRLDAIEARLEEIQQEARAAAGRRGHSEPGDKEEMDKLLGGQHPNGAFRTPDDELRYDRLNTRVPDAPFKDAADYARLEIKKQLLNAVNDDQDYLALTRGRDQAARYGFDPDHPKGRAFEHIYDQVNRGELAKLARQYGAEIVDLPMNVGTQADIRPDILQEFGVEDTGEFIDFIRHNDSAGGLGAMGTFLHQIDVGATPPEMLERGTSIAEEIGKIMDEQEQMDNQQNDDPHNRMKADEWNRYMMRTNSAIRELFNEYKDIADTMYSLYSKKRFADDPSLGLEGVESFPALKLTPEIRQKIRDTGVSLWAVPAAAAGMEMLDQDEEPPGMANGGRVKKNAGGEVGLTELQRQERENEAQRNYERRIFGGEPPPIEVNEGESYRQYRQRMRREWEEKGRAEWEARHKVQKKAEGGFLDGLRGALDQWNEFMLPGDVEDPTMQEARVAGKEGIKRLVGSGLSNVYGVDDEGKVRLPFIHDPKVDKAEPPLPGIVDQTLALPDWFAQWGGGRGPEWSQVANDRTEQALAEIESRLGYTPADDPSEYFIEAGGTMLTQPMVPGGTFKALKEPFLKAGQLARDVAGPVLGRAGQAASLVPRAGIEFFGPMIEASPYNYVSGTAFGGGLRTLVDKIMGTDYPEEIEDEDITEADPDLEIPETTPEEIEAARAFNAALRAKLDGLAEEAGMAKGGKVVRANRIMGKVRERLEALAQDVQHGIRSGRMTENDFIKNDEKAKRLYDLMYKLEDVQEEPTKHAKGGKVPPKTSLKELRESVMGMFRTPEVEGTGQEMVPVDPPAPVGDIEIQLDDLGTQAEQPSDKPSLRETPVSRRDVLKGMASLANPIQFDPMSLLAGADMPSAEPVKDVAAPIMGVIARMNDREGYERGAWGPTAAGAWRNLVNQMAEGLQPNGGPGHSEFEDIQQLHDILNEYGVDYHRGFEHEALEQTDDPFQDLMQWFRGELPGSGESTQHGLDHRDLAEWLRDPDFSSKENAHPQRVIDDYAEANDKTSEEVREMIAQQLEKEGAAQLIYDPEDLEVSDNVRTVYKALADEDLLEDRREYQIDDLKQSYPELTWAEASELRWLIENSFTGRYPDEYYEAHGTKREWEDADRKAAGDFGDDSDE